MRIIETDAAPRGNAGRPFPDSQAVIAGGLMVDGLLISIVVAAAA